jgi:hypothetical protein
MKTKKEIFEQIIEELTKIYNSTVTEIDSVSQAAIDAPGRNESRYDTAKVELGFLANSLSAKAVEMGKVIQTLSIFPLPPKSGIVLIGSLVEVTMNNKNQILFVLPCGGGQKITFDDVSVIVISKAAPLFSFLINKKGGETITFNGRPVKINNIE